MTVQSADNKNHSRSAIVVIVFTVFALALGDAVIKEMSASLTLWQIFCLRALVVVPVLLILLMRQEQKQGLMPIAFSWTLLRSLMLTLMWVGYYAALPHISLAVAAASYYTLPIFITLFASLFLGERINAIGWSAVLLGFVGIVLVLQPRATDLNVYAVLPIASAILYALAMILTRSKCRSENILVLSLWLNLTMLILGVVVSIVLRLYSTVDSADSNAFLFGRWTDMRVQEWSTIGLLSIAILIGSIGAAFAYQNGRPSTIATFDFAYVAFAVMWGIFFFDEYPNAAASAGILFIVVAGFLSVRQSSKSDQDSPS